MIEVYSPHQNLGCFGIKVVNPWDNQQIMYADFYFHNSGGKYFRPGFIYLNLLEVRRTIGLWFIRKWR